MMGNAALDEKKLPFVPFVLFIPFVPFVPFLRLSARVLFLMPVQRGGRLRRVAVSVVVGGRCGGCAVDSHVIERRAAATKQKKRLSRSVVFCIKSF